MTMDEAGLRRLIRRGEGAKLDFKARLDLATKDLRAQLVKHVLAIADTRGSLGYLVFGVDDQGKPTGQLRNTPTEEQIQQVIREYSEPYVDTSYQILSVDGLPVGLLTISRQAEKLPYRVAKSVGGGDKAISRDDIFYRYGRHSMKAQYTDMLDLISEGERARRKLAIPPAADSSLDAWRFLTTRERQTEMDRTLKTLLPSLVASQRQVADPGNPLRNPMSACALADVAGKRFLTFWYVWPEDVSANALGFESHWETSNVRPKRRSALSTTSRMKFVLAYGNVTKSMRLPQLAYPGGLVLVPERFGMYVGPSRDYIVRPTGPQPGPSHARPVLEPSLYVKNVRSDTLMAAAIEQCLDWVAHNTEHIPDVPFPFP